MAKSSKIKVGIIGVGNCAKSLVEGVQYYAENNKEETETNEIKAPVVEEKKSNTNENQSSEVEEKQEQVKVEMKDEIKENLEDKK